MITKEEAMTNNMFMDASGHTWRRNGKTITWKSARNAHRFKVPLKHGLYAYAYIDENNAEQFNII